MQTKYTSTLLASGLSLSLLLTPFAQAQDAAQCETVTLTNPGWTDINATTGVATTLLSALGYKTDVKMLAVLIGFEGLKSGDVDLFLGNWMPAQQKFMARYEKDVDLLGTNLSGAKFTLAVPQYVYDAGVHDYADLAKFSDQFRSRIYGIEPGSASNSLLQKMIKSGDFGLDDWQVIESGEQGVMSQVERSIRRKQFIVFLGWEPHPMNTNMDIAYLTGGDDYFGPNYGGAIVRTMSRKGYAQQCPNVAKLAENLKFSLGMENQMMGLILEDDKKGPAAAAQWMSQHPEVVKAWLDGVTTYHGEPAYPAVEKQLENQG